MFTGRNFQAERYLPKKADRKFATEWLENDPFALSVPEGPALIGKAAEQDAEQWRARLP